MSTRRDVSATMNHLERFGWRYDHPIHVAISLSTARLSPTTRTETAPSATWGPEALAYPRLVATAQHQLNFYFLALALAWYGRRASAVAAYRERLDRERSERLRTRCSHPGGRGSDDGVRAPASFQKLPPYAVQRASIANPDSPPSIAMMLRPTARRRHSGEVLKDPTASDARVRRSSSRTAGPVAFAPAASPLMEATLTASGCATQHRRAL